MSKKIRLQCSQVVSYDKIIEIDDEEWDILKQLKPLDDVSYYNNPDAYQIIDDNLSRWNSDEVEEEFTSITVELLEK